MNQFRAFVAKVGARMPPTGAAAGAAKGSGGGGAITALALIGLGTYGAYHSMVTVQPGHQGVIYNRFSGLDERSSLKEGLNFVIPWFQRAVVFDIRTRPQPIDTTSGSKGDPHLQRGCCCKFNN